MDTHRTCPKECARSFLERAAGRNHVIDQPDGSTPHPRMSVTTTGLRPAGERTAYVRAARLSITRHCSKHCNQELLQEPLWMCMKKNPIVDR